MDRADHFAQDCICQEICERYTRITGSKGEIKWEGRAEGPIIVYDFVTQTEKLIKPDLGKNIFR